MTQISIKWKPNKAEKKLSTARKALYLSEDIWFLGPCDNMRPMATELVLTPLRLVALEGREIKFEARYPEIASLTTNENKETVTVTRRDGRSMVIKQVPKGDHGAINGCFNLGLSTPPPPEILEAEAAATATPEALAALRIEKAKTLAWPQSTVRGQLSQKASLAVHRQCHGDEQPWLILTSSGGAGTLVAFDDRIVIIKTGGWTSYMAGSLGGERSATFHFTDITGFEYNSGFSNGVLEVLTASYSGSANHDFWRGSGKSRNADGNDPWTLSNCLPLSKDEYSEYLANINELKALIGKSKQMILQVVASTPLTPVAPGLVDQLEKLASLRNSGVLSEDEFAAAKARLLTS